MSDLHEVVFRWPYEAKTAIVTGTFDQWKCSLNMRREGPSGFTATVRVPWDAKVLYKFLIDGAWTPTDQAPTEPDVNGNINNVYRSPEKPKDTRHEPPAAREPVVAPTPAPKQPTEVVTPVPPPVHPAPPAPVNVTKPVDTPPKTKDVPPLLPTPAPPLFVVPVNDPTTVDKRPPALESPDHPGAPSTHAPPVNSPRKPLTPPTLKEDLNGTTDGTVDAKPTQQPPATPNKDATPSTPTTSKTSNFSGSASSSPTSSPTKKEHKRRHSFIHKFKRIFTPEKGEKGHHKATSQNS